MTTQQCPLSYYLDLSYPYTIVPDNGAFFIEFPDLPGCMTQVRSESEIPQAAEEIRTLWIETAHEEGWTIPEPAMYSEFSGKFVARVSKSLHRELVVAARQEGVSLNAYVGYLLAGRSIAAQLNASIEGIEAQVSSLSARLPYKVDVERHSDSVTRTITESEIRAFSYSTVAVC